METRKWGKQKKKLPKRTTVLIPQGQLTFCSNVPVMSNNGLRTVKPFPFTTINHWWFNIDWKLAKWTRFVKLQKLKEYVNIRGLFTWTQKKMQQIMHFHILSTPFAINNHWWPCCEINNISTLILVHNKECWRLGGTHSYRREAQHSHLRGGTAAPLFSFSGTTSRVWGCECLRMRACTIDTAQRRKKCNNFTEKYTSLSWDEPALANSPM